MSLLDLRFANKKSIISKYIILLLFNKKCYFIYAIINQLLTINNSNLNI